MKKCRSCGKEKPYEDFHRNHKRKDGREYICKDCKSAYSRWRQDNKDKLRKYVVGGDRKRIKRAENLSWKYGLREVDYQTMLDEQGGVCAVCSSSPKGKRLHVDHDHKSGRVRGLLCYNCNSAFGHIKDDKNILQRMLDYLLRGESDK